MFWLRFGRLFRQGFEVGNAIRQWPAGLGWLHSLSPLKSYIPESTVERFFGLLPVGRGRH